MKYTAISINMDSFGHAIGRMPLDDDPFWFETLDAILSITDKYNIKLTFYVIGRDLESPSISNRVRDLYRLGHEIGNHTYSHLQEFGSLDLESAKREITKTHELITNSIGTEPKSFLAPAWNWNPQQIGVLRELGYTSDTSIFPSPLMFAVSFKLILNYITSYLKTGLKPKTYKLASVLKRRDLKFSLFGQFLIKKSNRFWKGIDSRNFVQLEMHVSKLGIPYWFTLEFISQSLASHAFRSLKESDMKYFLFHPADFANTSKFKSNSEYHAHSLERGNIDKTKYLEIFEKRLQSLAEDSKFVTMSELAQIKLVKKVTP